MKTWPISFCFILMSDIPICWSIPVDAKPSVSKDSWIVGLSNWRILMTEQLEWQEQWKKKLWDQAELPAESRCLCGVCGSHKTGPWWDEYSGNVDAPQCWVSGSIFPMLLNSLRLLLYLGHWSDDPNFKRQSGNKEPIRAEQRPIRAEQSADQSPNKEPIRVSPITTHNG